MLPTGSETNLGSLSDKSVLLDFATSQILLRTGSDRHQTFCHLLSERERERVENLETNKLKIHPAEKISKFVRNYVFSSSNVSLWTKWDQVVCLERNQELLGDKEGSFLMRLDHINLTKIGSFHYQQDCYINLIWNYFDMTNTSIWHYFNMTLVQYEINSTWNWLNATFNFYILWKILSY